MPVIIPKSLPATITLEKEAVFVMNEFRASSQDIRPLKLVIVNLTELYQSARQLSYGYKDCVG